MQIQENVSLKPYNTFGVAAVARFFVEVAAEAELVAALESKPDAPLLILGGGSNLLFTQDWEGLVIRLALTGKEVVSEDEDSVTVRFAAGENWHEAVCWTVDQGWGGLENLSLIPGQIGTTPVQNIGAYGVEVKDTIVSVEAVSRVNPGMKKVFTNQECEFGYRDSIFKQAEKGKWIITAVSFKLAKNPVLKLDYGAIKDTLCAQNVENPTVKSVSEAVISIRQSKLPDPVEIGNGGSFFKNPIITPEDFEKISQDYPNMPHYPAGDMIKVPAGWLIDQAGWKGHRAGEAGVHDKQALVLVNHGEATGAEIWALAQAIQADITDKFGIMLEPEINVI